MVKSRLKEIPRINWVQLVVQFILFLLPLLGSAVWTQAVTSTQIAGLRGEVATIKSEVTKMDEKYVRVTSFNDLKERVNDLEKITYKVPLATGRYGR